LIVLTLRAERQVRELRQYYDDHDRPEAIRALASTLERAWELITTNPAVGLPAPRPYPRLARSGVAWIKTGRYWIAYSPQPPAIVGVHFETANIPGRM
jgi:plasmid stabilization system protein ParE